VTYWAYDLDVSGSPTHNISIHILSYILNIFHSKNPNFAPLKEKERRSACIGSAIDDYLTSLSISFIFKIRIGVSLCELERYLDEERADDDVYFDILVWWKQNSCRYPVLSTMVRDVLATPVSTVASESAFSTGGRVLDTYRSSLSPQMAEALICAQNWLKPTLSQFKDLNINEEYEFSDTVVSGI
jgi:hypothetical protein